MSDDKSVFSKKTASLDDFRADMISKLDKSKDRIETQFDYSTNLYGLGLTCYSSFYSIESSIYSAIAASVLDPSITLHPQQLAFIQEIFDRDSLIFSAPTSFGKTFCLFEYLARAKPNKVVLVVPTLALVKEYLETITIKYSEKFGDYKVRLYASSDEQDLWTNEEKTILILTHEKVITAQQALNLQSIDFFAIDEVYKLDIKHDDSRTLTMNVAFLELAKISKKYVLLAPFIAGVKNMDLLPGKPHFLSTHFQPVVNKVTSIEIPNSEPETRFSYTSKLLKADGHCKGRKTLVFFPSPKDIRQFLLSPINGDIEFDPPDDVQSLIDWCEKEVSPKWSLVIALKKGFLLHTGQIFSSLRNYETDLFDNPEKNFQTLLCTSTLLEGVNTPAEKLIITFPSRSKSKEGAENYFSAFEFYNLVGRTGRLFKHLVGETYYLKTEQQPLFDKNLANEYIEFEATTDSEDIKIQMSDGEIPQNVKDILGEANITEEEYKKEIGPSIRVKDFKKISSSFVSHKENIRKSAKRIIENTNDSSEQWRGLQALISEICFIAGIKSGLSPYQCGRLITFFLTNPKDSTAEILRKAKISDDEIDKFADAALRLRSGAIENTFIQASKTILLLMKKNGFSENECNTVIEKIINKANAKFFIDSPKKHMLLELGFYDADINTICTIIGDDFADIFDLKKRLKKEEVLLKLRISLLSRLSLDKLIKGL